MVGLILCGGKSTRMGSDKGLYDTAGITWAESAYRKMYSLVSSMTISVNREQITSYQKHFAENELIVDQRDLKIGGPLCGLLSAHIAFPDKTFFLLACDLLYMEPIVLESIVALQKDSPNYDAYVFTIDQAMEPLCGIYKASALQKIMAAYRENSLGKHSMKHVLELVNTLKVELPLNWHQYFKNVNTHHDLNR